MRGTVVEVRWRRQGASIGPDPRVTRRQLCADSRGFGIGVFGKYTRQDAAGSRRVPDRRNHVETVSGINKCNLQSAKFKLRSHGLRLRLLASSSCTLYFSRCNLHCLFNECDRAPLPTGNESSVWKYRPLCLGRTTRLLVRRASDDTHQPLVRPMRSWRARVEVPLPPSRRGRP